MLQKVERRKTAMMTVWNREDIPYDAMGDYSMFEFENPGREDDGCADQDRRNSDEL